MKRSATGESGLTKQSSESSVKEQPHPNESMVYLVFLALLMDLLAFTMILPLLPSILDYYADHDKDGLYSWLADKVTNFRVMLGAPDTRKFNSVLFGGVIGSLFSLLQFFASPLIGGLSDVYGRKRLMLLTMVGMMISYIVWAMSKNFGIFLLARIIGGASKGNVSLSSAIVTDVSSEKTRGKGMALIGVAFSLGFLLGPLIGASFARLGASSDDFYVAPALLAVAVTVLDLMIIKLLFKETLPPESRATSLVQSLADATNLINPISLFKFSPMKNTQRKDLDKMERLGLVYFLYLFLYSGLEFTLTFLTHTRFHYTGMEQGRMFFFIGIIMAAVQGGYVRRIAAGNEQKTATRGILLVIPSFVIIGLAESQFLLYTGLALYSFASATVVPCMTTLISGYGSADQKGKVIGIFRSLGALARALGPFFACVLYWSAGPLVCYSIGGALLIAPLSLLFSAKL